MIPVELGETSWQRQQFDKKHNDANLSFNLDLIYEIREKARVSEEAAKHIVA